MIEETILNCLPWLAVWIVLSGLDDAVLDISLLRRWWRSRRGSAAPAPSVPHRTFSSPSCRIAIIVPCWREDAVITPMVEHNVAAIEYNEYDIFVGAYPNDDATLSAVRLLEARFPQVHLAVCPHDGPTSKADCLNWVYQRLLLHEEMADVKYSVIVTHDAEDLIHPYALQHLCHYAPTTGMAQVPVLALPTPWWEWVHGIYIDEFAQMELRDMPARSDLGGFIPSSGVGTGFSRDTLESIAEHHQNRIFEPSCLTEDYENGLRVHLLGHTQRFIPVQRQGGSWMATREYFPRTLRAAVRQRTRWVTGISLQGWERNGWCNTWRTRYWLWRDRKGLVGNPLSLLTNLFWLYGCATWLLSHWQHTPWRIAAGLHTPLTRTLLALTTLLWLGRTASRMWCVQRLYGWPLALGVPVRLVLANFVNTWATLAALRRYTVARCRKRPLVWLKTEHAYPTRATLQTHKRSLQSLLVGLHYLTESELQEALERRPAGMRLGEYLVARKLMNEEELYEALSLQQCLPVSDLRQDEVMPSALRCLPSDVVRTWRVLPFRVEGGELHVATPEVPSEELQAELRQHTQLKTRFHLVTPTRFAVWEALQ